MKLGGKVEPEDASQVEAPKGPRGWVVEGDTLLTPHPLGPFGASTRLRPSALDLPPTSTSESSLWVAVYKRMPFAGHWPLMLWRDQFRLQSKHVQRTQQCTADVQEVYI